LFDEVKHEIILELRNVLDRLEADAQVKALLGSYGDTLSDEDVLDGIREWLTTFAPAL
jgi:hypothetical protein